MNAIALLGQLATLGITVVIEGDDLILEPGSKLPTELIPELKAHISKIIDCLHQQTKDSLGQRYHQSYQGEGLINAELTELERRVEVEGFVLCHSELLDDFIAFHRDDVDLTSIPAGFVPYADHELRELFGQDKPDITASALRLIHTTKVTGASVTGNHEDIPLPLLLERLRKGHSWLCDEYQRSFDEPVYDTEKLAAGLATWDELENTLRVVYGYIGCVFGEGEQCPEGAPVQCHLCKGVGGEGGVQ